MNKLFLSFGLFALITLSACGNAGTGVDNGIASSASLSRDDAALIADSSTNDWFCPAEGMPNVYGKGYSAAENDRYRVCFNRQDRRMLKVIRQSKTQTGGICIYPVHQPSNPSARAQPFSYFGQIIGACDATGSPEWITNQLMSFNNVLQYNGVVIVRDAERVAAEQFLMGRSSTEPATLAYGLIL